MLSENGVFFVGEKKEVVSKKLPVFYNPVMKDNRDLSIKIINTLRKDLRIGLPLAGSGIRGLRIYKECSNVKEIALNDVRKDFKEDLIKSIEYNNFKKTFFEIHNTEANIFLHREKYFDYVDVDPFGSPNKFLDSSIQCLKNNGVLAVTATDTGALAGSFPKACMRKYWSKPLKNEFMHEFGLRILISKIQLVGAQHEKYLKPLVGYFKNHYYRVFFKLYSNRNKSEKVFEERAYYEEHGPIYTGKLGDIDFLKKIEKDEFVDLLKEEYSINTIGFCDLHKRAEKLKLKKLPKTSTLIEEIRNKGYEACRTHFNPHGIKTNMKEKDLNKLIQQLS